MDTLEQKDIKQLMDTSGEWCISLYMPAHRAGREQQQDPIRFKNLIAQAEEKLLEYGVRRPEVQEMMRPMERLTTDTHFWRHQSDGLAVFLLSNGYLKTYRLPSKFEELMVISKSFHIKPLLPLINKNGQFYILAVSLNNVRLFLGNRDLVNEVKLPNIPTNMQEALHMDDPEKQLGFHTGTRNPGTHGSQPAVFYGQGNQTDDDEKNILRYFQLVDAGLKTILNEESIPMALAGVDYLFPIYQKANSYDGLLQDGLIGNPDEMDDKELHRRAWKLIEPVFDKKKREATKQFELLHGKKSDLATNELKMIVKAAKYGQVDTLFVPLNVQLWGRFEQNAGKVFLADKFNAENEDLLNYAATQTILNAGQVFALESEEIPGSGDQAAILRY